MYIIIRISLIYLLEHALTMMRSKTVTALILVASIHSSSCFTISGGSARSRARFGAVVVTPTTLFETLLEEKSETTLDDTVDAPASVVFYDQVNDDTLLDGVVCARGVCVLVDDEDLELTASSSIVDRVINSYLGPRLLLAAASVLYGTNFPLGVFMNEALPPSAATSARMVMAGLALSPFLFKLNPKIAPQALLCGCFTALGYISQSMALVTVSPATVAFLGAGTVVVPPALDALVDKKPMGFKDAPQTWLAAILCLTGVAILELFQGPNPLETLGVGDVLALGQSLGFGTSFFLTERMMRGQPDQALPITAIQVSVTGLLSMIWCFTDGWIGSTGSESFGLPQLFLDPTMQMAAGAVLWTGVITTALNRFVETTALGKVTSAEASVILATEPLWAALFAALWLGESFGINDYVGGALIVAACLANSLKPEDLKFLVDRGGDDTDGFAP